MQLESQTFSAGQLILARCGFGLPGTDGPFVFAGNRSPRLAWNDAHEGRRSFRLTCIDIDVPSRSEEVNHAGCMAPAGLPCIEFGHWLMAAAWLNWAETLAASAFLRAEYTHRPVRPVHGRASTTAPVGSTPMPEVAGDYPGHDGPPVHLGTSSSSSTADSTPYAQDASEPALPKRFDLCVTARSDAGGCAGHGQSGWNLTMTRSLPS